MRSIYKKTYYFVNVLVFMIVGAIFLISYSSTSVFANISFKRMITLICTAILIHFIKALRFYVVLYGQGLSLVSYTKTYCKVTPASIIFPFKIGEIFRMYYYGIAIKNMFRSIVSVLLDRFMDTIALLTIVIALVLVKGGKILELIWVLLLFLFLLLFLYLVFPSVYLYWKKIFLSADATPKRNKVLIVLEYLNRIYKEIMNVIKGRGVTLYLMSILAWAVEIKVFFLITKELNDYTSIEISEYLSSAIMGNQVSGMRQFVFISVLLLFAVYLLVKMIEICHRKSE